MSENLWRKKCTMVKSWHRFDDVKMCLQSPVAIGFNCLALVKMVTNIQAQ
jgi:hypothetical protein